MRIIDADSLLESISTMSDLKMNGVTIAVAVAKCVTIDAVPVVRCRECKYRFKNNGHDKSGCPIIDANIWMDDDDFCSHGERK